jgi:phospholipase A1
LKNHIKFVVCMGTYLFILFAVISSASAGSPDGISTRISSTSFELQPYKPMYFTASYDRTISRQETWLQDAEVKFQYSFRFPFYATGHQEFSFAYTQVSYWQLFNYKNSSPFRESNYAPEFIYMMRHDTKALAMESVDLVLSPFMHESNGMGGSASRSWNRAYAQVVLNWDTFKIGLKPWYRYREQPKDSPTDLRGDDNPDIQKYMGNGELTAELQAGNSRFILTARDNYRKSPNYGAIQLDGIFTLADQLKFYVQYFNG